MGRKGTSKRKKAKQKATGDSGSSVLKEINQPEKVVGLGRSKAPPKGNNKQ